MSSSIEIHVKEAFGARLTDDGVRNILAKCFEAYRAGVNMEGVYKALVQGIQSSYRENKKDPYNKVSQFLMQMYEDAEGDIPELFQTLGNMLPHFLYNEIDDPLQWAQAAQNFRAVMFEKELRVDQKRREAARQEVYTKEKALKKTSVSTELEARH